MIRVTCAIIRNEENDVLVVRRGENSDLPDKWEFPGGKVKEGESYEECIIREIKEELSIEISIVGKLQPVEYHYPEKSIRLIPFVCRIKSGDIILTDHSEFRWLTRNEIPTLTWASADLKVMHTYFDDAGIET